MGRCLAKIPHDCGTKHGLQVFEEEDGTVSGYCFSCSTYVRDPYGDRKFVKDIPNLKPAKSKEEVEEELAEIEECSACDLVERRLRKDVLDYYGVKVGMDRKDGVTPRLVYLPYTSKGKVIRYKIRLLGIKKMWNIGPDKDLDLFGWEQAISSGARRLIITEGEYDAIALKKIIDTHTKKEYEEFKPAVVSLIAGIDSVRSDLSRLAPKIRKHFKEITFCFDSDGPGEEATIEACKIFPEGNTITLPCKDANECILKGKTKGAFKAIMFNKQKPKNTRLVWVDDVWESAKEAPERGVDWPWPDVTRVTRGIRKGETIYIGAGPKMGKSEVVNALASHLVENVGWKILLAKPEESNKKTVKLLAGKVVGARFHDPDVEFDEEAFENAGKVLLGNKVMMLNLYQHIGWESLKQDIIAAAGVGIDAVFIDPITNLTNGMSAADANVKLQEIAEELSALALDLNVAVFIFCHLRNPDSGPEHNRGGKVESGQFAGSRAMARSCNYMFGLEGNKDPELSEGERNARRLVLLEDREFGEVNVTNLYWNPRTTNFIQV